MKWGNDLTMKKGPKIAKWGIVADLEKARVLVTEEGAKVETNKRDILTKKKQ